MKTKKLEDIFPPNYLPSEIFVFHAGYKEKFTPPENARYIFLSGDEGQFEEKFDKPKYVRLPYELSMMFGWSPSLN